MGYSLEGKGVAWRQIFDFLFGTRGAVATAGMFIFEAHVNIEARWAAACLFKTAHLV